MPRDLFTNVAAPAARLGSHRWYALPLSILIHSTVLAEAIIVPILAPSGLPVPPGPMIAWMPAVAAPPAETPPRPRSRAAAPVSDARVSPDAAPLAAPSGIRPESGLVPEPALPAAAVEWGPPGGAIAAVAEAPPEAPPPDAPIRVHAGVRPPVKVTHVSPAYPPLAVAARVQGVVILEAVIGRDGRVTDARVLRSIPLLDQAAIDAVRQWVFTPALLNGAPVPVVMTVTVVFALR